MDNSPRKVNHYDDGTASVLRKPTDYKKLRFYHRSDVLYQLTQSFCKRYFRKWGDRTVDQMVQAARSGKQNIVEGSVDGRTSMEMEIKLLNAARGSNRELCEDYQDYLKHSGMAIWLPGHPRYGAMLDYCRQHYLYTDYKELFPKMDAEEMANMALCLSHQVDKALEAYIARKDREFTTEGGIRERMTAARLNQRETQREIIDRQAREITQLKQQIARLQDQIARLQNLDRR
ncbi:MAG: four helix bundle suffix domain-containing protein [Muribaculaceae bacterium]|nr:four helix bundle suffix domain-containing protein [Muribaculaceae bacterium]